MSQVKEYSAIAGAVLLASLLVSGCEGDARPFLEAAEIQALDLQRIDVVPPVNEITGNVVINSGQSLQLGLEGNSQAVPNEDTDSSVELSANDRNWRTSDASVVEVTRNGLITGRSDGTATVSVDFGSLTGSLPITVDDAELTAISIAAADGDLEVEPCLPETFFAIGSFVGGTERPVYDAEYFLDDDATVPLIPDEDSRVQVNATTPGAVTLNATANGVSGLAQLTVLDTLVEGGIVITPEAVAVDVDQTRDLGANATYTTGLPAPGDRKVETVTSSVNWTISSGAGVANVENTGMNKGRVSGLREGTAGVTASCGNVTSDERQITVNAAAAESDILSFEVDGSSVDSVVKMEVDETRILRVSRSAAYDRDKEVTDNLEFTAETFGRDTPLIDLDQLNISGIGNFTIDPLPNAAGSTTEITVKLVDEDDRELAEGKLTVVVTNP